MDFSGIWVKANSCVYSSSEERTVPPGHSSVQCPRKIQLDRAGAVVVTILITQSRDKKRSPESDVEGWERMGRAGKERGQGSSEQLAVILRAHFPTPNLEVEHSNHLLWLSSVRPLLIRMEAESL